MLRNFFSVIIGLVLLTLTALLVFIGIRIFDSASLGQIVGAVGIWLGALLLLAGGVGYVLHRLDRAAELDRAYGRLDDIEALLIPAGGGAAPANAADLEAEKRRLTRRRAQLEGTLVRQGDPVAVHAQGGNRVITRSAGYNP